jgi:hypothetical protein
MQNDGVELAAKFSILIGCLITKKYEIPKVDVARLKNRGL